MDYEKKYKEALEVAQKLYQDCPNGKNDRLYHTTDLEKMFPELAESEDEKIRKEIIKYIERTFPNEFSGIESKNKWIAWLESKGEREEPQIYETKDGEIITYSETDGYKIIDKPKFHEGEWITNGDYTWKIVEVKPLDYILQSQEGNIVDDTISHVDEQFHSFTIKDAKDGDVLQLGKVTAIFQKYIGNGNCKCYCSVCDGVFEIPSKDGADNSYGCYNAIPATKEQRNLLFQKMKEAGYKWDAEKKELKKIEQKSQRMVSAEAKEAMYDKPAWSEEDQNALEDVREAVVNYWGGDTQDILLYWLKSLKQRYTWKPSDEQMEALKQAKTDACGKPYFNALASLYVNLQKS